MAASCCHVVKRSFVRTESSCIKTWGGGSGYRSQKQNKDHSLTGSYIPHRECHIQPDWLLVYYQTETELYLYRTGTHSDLFGL